MGMDLGGKSGKRGKASPSMNVTPLVDVVLVLLILFMVIMPMMDAKFWVHVPPEPEEDVEPSSGEPAESLTIYVGAEGSVRINAAEVEDAELSVRLERMLVARETRQVYFDAHDAVSFSRAMTVMDLARAGGAAHIAVLTDALTNTPEQP